MEEGQIEVDSVLPITYADITPQLARESGFKSVIDLLKVAKHGPGENVYLIRFHYVPASAADARTAVRKARLETTSKARRRSARGRA
jgi:hypothetical protein